MKIYKYETISQVGELALLERLKRCLPLRGDVIVGAGDDCAVVRGAHSDGFDYLLKSDSCVEGVHFTPQTKGELVGNKALGRVLSDMAAMGGEPLWILVDLVAPSKTPVRQIEKIYDGMTKLARQFNVAIVGGDVSAGRDLQLHVFGVGRVEKGKAILRSGARAGEAIFVTGSLGGSLTGKHLNFQPRLREGQWLAKSGWATSMIDISDGLLRDLGHIIKGIGISIRVAAPVRAWILPRPRRHRRGYMKKLRLCRLIQANKIGARLILNAIPISTVARQCSDRKNVLKHALNDGEDYELLFTVPKKKVESFIKAWRLAFRLSCVQIGWITSRSGKLEGVDLKGKIIKLNDAGFEHFR